MGSGRYVQFMIELKDETGLRGRSFQYVAEGYNKMACAIGIPASTLI